MTDKETIQIKQLSKMYRIAFDIQASHIDKRLTDDEWSELIDNSSRLMQIDDKKLRDFGRNLFNAIYDYFDTIHKEVI